MLKEIKTFFLSLNKITLAQAVAAFLGLILITAIPYAGGLGKNWMIPLADGYRISFFYAAEIIIYISGLFVFGFHIKNKVEKFLFIALFLVLASRIISLIFAPKFDWVQVISFMRYVEVFLTIYILTNILEEKGNRIAFISGLAIGDFLESIVGFAKFVFSSGALRGIVIGIPAYQLLILFILSFILLFSSEKKWLLLFFIIVLLLGIIATQTRSALLQLGLGLVLITFWGIKQKTIKDMLSVILITIIFTISASFTFNSMFADTQKRMTEITEGGGTIQWRLYLWDKATGAFLNHPITGIGSGGFGRQLKDLPQVFNVSLQRADKNNPISSHNTVLGIMAETGIVGLIAYGIWLVAIIKLILVTIKYDVGDAFTIACVMMMCIFIFGDFWSQNSFLPNTSFMLAYILGSLRENISV